MAATNKDQLLEITRKEYEKLAKLIGPIELAQAQLKGGDEISIKDVIGHRAHWIDLFLGWYNDGLAGKSVYFPAEGYKWNDLKRYNFELRLKQKNTDWDFALASLQECNNKLVYFIQNHSNSELYGAPMKGANNNWTPGRWAEAAGPSHFRSAGKYIRSRLKSM